MHTSSGEGIPRLQVQGLTAGYGADPVIRDVSVSVHAGQIATVIGPNGAGKSTLLKAVMGFLRLASGSVLLDGASLNGQRAAQIARRGVGYVPQVRDIFDSLSVGENLEMGAYLVPKRHVAQRLDEVFELFPQLSALRRQRADNLSGGERKMLAMARVLMGRPRVLLLDEPTANLAPKMAHGLLHEHVTRLAAANVAVLLVEQRAADALSIADWAYVMVSGRVATDGAAADLHSRADIGKLFLGRASRTTQGGSP